MSSNAKYVQSVRKDLKNSAEEKVRESGQRFFKEQLLAYGVKMPIVKSISKSYSKKLKELTKEEVFELCETLWKSGYIEEAMVACQWTYALRKQFVPTDFKFFKDWIDQYVTNWATCDTFCNHAVGAFVMQYREYRSSLMTFTTSKNLWTRRAAAVSLIVPARKGYFLEFIFEIADRLLTDKEDLVQKGYGWMLKEASKAHAQQVFDYIMKNKSKMPRTALRYAIEKLPKDLKARAMEK